MKRKKKIIIKNPKLRQIRNNLRYFIIKAELKEISNLINNQRKYLHSFENRELYTLNGAKRAQQFEIKSQKLEKLLNKSICKCPVCQCADKDMKYNPKTDIWFCIDCYK